jgi:hypothetical protein
MRDSSVHSGFVPVRLNRAAHEAGRRRIVNSYAARLIQAVGR